VKGIIKTKVAFANNSGDTLIVDVEDGSKDTVGIENPLDEEECLCSLIADSIYPHVISEILLTVDTVSLLINSRT
jgi:predicted HTH transcriptional regulator